jgi:hypothetical protein
MPVTDIQTTQTAPVMGRPKGRRTDGYEFTLAQVRSLRKEGKTYREIGERLGFTRQTANYYGKSLSTEHVCSCCGQKLRQKPKTK